jgi:hypothetical protein
MTKHALGCIAICLGQALAAPAWALSLGMADTFAGGADGGWSTGVASIAPPVVVADGGPAGTGDGYLRLTSLGGAGASSKLSAIAGAQWTGDYIAAGVDRITLDLVNLGSTDLSLRLWLSGPPGVAAVSTTAVLLPAGSGWTHASFALDAASLTGNPAAALPGVQQLRLFHGSSAAFPGEAIAAVLGLDNITAVPEPKSAWLLVPGLAVLLGLRRRPAA